MLDVIRKLNDILDRGVKLRLLFAGFASIILALLDTVAIALVLPLVSFAAGSEAASPVSALLARLLPDLGSSGLTIVMAGLVIGLFVVKDVGAIAFSWWLNGFKSFNRVRTSSMILRHYMTAPYTKMAQRSSSELIRTMQDAVTQVYGSIVFGLMTLLTSVVSIAAIVAALLLSAPLQTLFLIVYFVVASAVYLKVVKPHAHRAGEVSAQSAQVAWQSAFAALGGLKEAKIRGSHEHFVEKYQSASMLGARAGRQAEFIGGLPRYLLEILFFIAIGAMMAIGMSTSEGASSGRTLGVLALFVAAGLRVLPAVTGMLGQISAIRFGVPFLQVVHDEVMEARENVQGPSHPGLTLGHVEVVRVENVHFRYPGADSDVLRGIDLKLYKGRSVALVGGSGAGKTTLVDIVLGLHTPTYGRVSVDGIDIQRAMRSWQSHIAYVPREVFILDATLAENIAFDVDREDIDEDRLAAALERSQLTDLVTSLPDGIDTYIGEHGSRLSGGQRQRVGIARAVYRQPDLLVLDEATSALDNETEHQISRAIEALSGEITTLIVAHRLSTVRHADVIVFLKNGLVADSGTFEELRAHNPDFDHLVRLGSLDGQVPAKSVTDLA